MKMQGFFDEHFDNAEAQADCKECGLYQNCESPQMKPTGKGKMGIMILGEAPGETEDQEGEQWVGKAGNLLQEFLSEFDINLKKDCRKHNAVCCRPMDSKGNNRTPTNSELALCRRNIVKAITEFKPKAIFLMGGSAVDSFFAFDPITNGMSISHLRGRAIPYHQYNCWVFPMFHPSYILRNGNDKKARRIFYRDLKTRCRIL
jgi:Uracil-DNA glycosylase